ncbi:MAG: hypothetical protein NTZ59_02400 [Bacteroidetes bacterium]|nr:hypothetical protein [Bacteroidota bacterium]
MTIGELQQWSIKNAKDFLAQQQTSAASAASAAAAAAASAAAATPNDIRLMCLEIIKTFGCMWQYNDMLNFYNNANNNNACYSAYDAYGLPPKNNGNCNWQQGMYKFFLASKLYAKFPLLNLGDTNNCATIKEMVDALEVEKLNVDKIYAADRDDNLHSYSLYVISDLQSKLNAAYSTMSCGKLKTTQQQKETLQTLETATASPAQTSTSKAIYIVAIVLVVVIIYKIFKR